MARKKRRVRVKVESKPKVGIGHIIAALSSLFFGAIFVCVCSGLIIYRMIPVDEESETSEQKAPLAIDESGPLVDYSEIHRSESVVNDWRRLSLSLLIDDDANREQILRLARHLSQDHEYVQLSFYTSETAYEMGKQTDFGPEWKQGYIGYLEKLPAREDLPASRKFHWVQSEGKFTVLAGTSEDL